jgi:hypothetical protein
MTETIFWAIVALAVALGIPIGLLIADIPDSVGAYVLFLTLVAVLSYTRETHKLRILSKRQIELSQEQIELSLKPHLEIVFQRAHFRLSNIGNGPAIHIRIDDAIVSLPQTPKMRLRFVCPPIVKKDECLPIEIRILWAENDRIALDMEPGIYTPPLATETIDIKARFDNLIGKEYVHNLLIGKGMPISTDPVDFLLQYLYEKHPKGIHPNEIPALYVDPKICKKLILYCLEKGFIDVDGSESDQEGIVDIREIKIKSTGIDYLLDKR